MKEFIKDILLALVIVLVITSVIKPTIVKQSSMEPTLYSNNYLFVNKLSYKTKDHPEYGDIIVFESNLPSEEGMGYRFSIKRLIGLEDDKGYKLLIKRVIGVEGDVITISDGVVYRNGEALIEDYTLEGFTSGEITELTVPENELFVMGDNRSVSLDSRAENVGTISEDDVVGKAFVRVFPFNEIGLL